MSKPYHITLGSTQHGPLSKAEVEAKIASGELTFAHHVWKSGEKSWTKVAEHEDFRHHFAGKSTRAWFIHYNKTQHGPLAQEDIERLISIGQASSHDLVWSEGMDGWKKIVEVSAFAQLEKTLVVDVPKPPKFEVPPVSSREEAKVEIEHRDAVRRPFAAKLIWSNDRTVNVASSRDISVGGMQVEAEHIPGPIGSKIKLNVSPLDSSGQPLAPFVAKGVIVRIREDQRGFSFRFDELPESAKKSIERFVS